MRSKWNVAAVVCVGFLFGLIVSQIIANVQIAQNFSIDERTCRHQQEAQAAQDWAAREDKKPAGDDQRAEAQKNARDYCVQRRSAVAGERQAEFGRRALNLGWVTLAAAIGAAMAAGFAAKYANDTVSTMRETSQRELRAYVSLTVQVIGNFGLINPVELDCQIHNHGSTPARKLNLIFGMGVFPNVLPQGFHLPPPTVRQTDDVTIFPTEKKSILLKLDRVLTPIEFANAMAGTHRFHFWGTMIYEDVFKNQRPTKLHVSTGGADFIASMRAAAAAGGAPLPFRIKHESEHHHVDEDADA